MKSSVSVILPSHDRAHLLRRSLDSVLAQSLPAHEVILIDDGSTDDTAGLVVQDYPQVRYLHQAQAGVSAARNAGIRLATGRWIAFLDSDDQWLPDKLERQILALRDNPGYRVCHGEEIWIRNGQRANQKRRHKKHGGWIFQQCLPLCVISPSAVLIERDLFAEVGWFDQNLPACEDYDLWLRLCARYPVLYLEKPLIVKHGGHPDQLSKKYPAMDRFRMTALEKVIRSDSYSDQQRVAALRVWRDKRLVYATGAGKRGRWQEVSALEKTALELQMLLHATEANSTDPPEPPA